MRSAPSNAWIRSPAFEPAIRSPWSPPSRTFAQRSAWPSMKRLTVTKLLDTPGSTTCNGTSAPWAAIEPGASGVDLIRKLRKRSAGKFCRHTATFVFADRSWKNVHGPPVLEVTESIRTHGGSVHRSSANESLYGLLLCAVTLQMMLWPTRGD